MRFKLGTFLMLVGLYFSIAFTTGLNDPLAKVIQSQWDLSTFESQFGNFSFFIAYILMGIPASMVVSKIGYKRGAQVALGGMALGTIIVMCGGNAHLIWLYLAGMFVIGCFITLLQVVVNPLIIAVGSERGANSRMNIGGMASSFGATAAPVVVGFIIGNAVSSELSVKDVNPVLFTLLGFFCVVFACLSLTKFDSTESISGTSEDNQKLLSRNLLSGLKRGSFVFGVVAIFLYVGEEVSTASLTNLYMMNELGIEPLVSGSVIGAYWMLMLVGRMLGAVVGTRIASGAQLLIVSSIALALYVVSIVLPIGYSVTMIGVDSSLTFIKTEIPVSILLLVLVGMCNSVMWTCIFILATRGLKGSTNLASGVFMMMVCGGGILPVVQGHLADMIGFRMSYVIGVLCLSVIFSYSIYSIMIVKNKIDKTS